MNWNIPGYSTYADISTNSNFSELWNAYVENGQTQSVVAPDDFAEELNQNVPMPTLIAGQTYYTRVFYDVGGYTDTKSVIAPECSEEEVFACLSLVSDKNSPQVGDTVNFTCSASASAWEVFYRFAYSIDGGAFTPISQIVGDTASLSIVDPGEYVVRCQACYTAGPGDGPETCDPIWQSAGTI